MRDAALEYAALGWPVCMGAHPTPDGPRGCSCDRVGCPDPGAHPLSPAWQMQASVDEMIVGNWWTRAPEANVVLPTGRVFDVFDVPASSGLLALARMDRGAVTAGPVAALGERYLLFVATRGAPDDEDEYWTCHLDCLPEAVIESPGLRWHCRDSYVLAPPSTLPYGQGSSWIRHPAGRPLPDPLRVLDVLADCIDD
jgi:hypothetical protein